MSKKSKQPKLSIITPSYNLGEYIERAIQSVLEQDYKNFEYWVIDGGSSDQTLEVLKKYEKKSPHKFNWISEPDQGQTDAINKGLARSSGDWFAWLNADDYYEPGALTFVAKTGLQHPQAGVVYGKCLSHLPSKIIANTPPKKITLEEMYQGNIIFGPSAFFNTQALKKVGPFDTKLHFWMDYEMFMRLARAGYEFEYIDQVLAHFTVRANQKSDSKHRLAMSLEGYQISRNYGGPLISNFLLQYLPRPITKILKRML